MRTLCALPALAASLLAVIFLASAPIQAQNTPPDDPSTQIPQPGKLGSPFAVPHSWNQFSFELAGSYSPAVGDGDNYYTKGGAATLGLIDRVALHWNALAEFHVFAQQGITSKTTDTSTSAKWGTTTILSVGLSALYDTRPHEPTAFYLIAGPGYYHSHTSSPCTGGDSCTGNVQWAVASENAFGIAAGGGIRHHIHSDGQASLYVESRYHWVDSNKTNFGRVTLLPISFGFRW